MITVEVVWMQESSPDFSSKVIMWAMKKPYSHIGIIGQASDGRRYLVHAIGEGVVYHDPVDYMIDHTVVRKKTVTLTCSTEFLTGFCLGETGKGYSDIQLILIALKENFGIPTSWLTRFLNNGAKRICSEFVAVILDRFSDYNMPMPLDFITPSQIEDILNPEVVGGE